MIPANCYGCGRCCTLLVEFVGGVDDDVQAEFGGGVYMPLIHGRCTALTPENTCSIYERRPLECRQFRRGSQHCRELCEDV
jgi:Fe-S-cluster containining protein